MKTYAEKRERKGIAHTHASIKWEFKAVIILSNSKWWMGWKINHRCPAFFVCRSSSVSFFLFQFSLFHCLRPAGVSVCHYFNLHTHTHTDISSQGKLLLWVSGKKNKILNWIFMLRFENGLFAKLKCIFF